MNQKRRRVEICTLFALEQICLFSTKLAFLFFLVEILQDKLIILFHHSFGSLIGLNFFSPREIFLVIQENPRAMTQKINKYHEAIGSIISITRGKSWILVFLLFLIETNKFSINQQKFRKFENEKVKIIFEQNFLHGEISRVSIFHLVRFMFVCKILFSKQRHEMR